MEIESYKNIPILEIPNNIGYWLVRADGGKYYEDFFLNNFIAVSDNEVTLEMIEECSENSIAGITIDHYKELYSKTYSDWTPQQIAQSASRTHKFLDQMNIGDLVLVPSRRSTHFLIGVITSAAFEQYEIDMNQGTEVNYAINPFFKRRQVSWIKEVSRSELSDKLYWMLSAHQTIFDLSEQKEYINQLLAPIYIQNGYCHGTIKISKREGLDSDEWYDLYSIIKRYSDHDKNKMIVKSNVQSPGLIEFITENPITVLAAITVLSAPIIGEINTKWVKIPGLIPYFQSYKRNKLEMKKIEKEMEMMDEDKRAKQLENERAQFELDKEKEIWQIQIKKEIEVGQLQNQLQISSFDAGKLVVNQTQTDNSANPDADEL